MGHVFRAFSFITDASAKDDSDTDSTAGQIENELENADVGGSSRDIDEVISVTSCKLKGGRVFTLLVLEDETPGG